MKQARAHVLISGSVQGVFFRANAQEMAEQYKLTGWVRNTSDGRVECLLEGDEEQVKNMLDWCSKGPAGSHVKSTEVEWGKPTGEFKAFYIKYSL